MRTKVKIGLLSTACRAAAVLWAIMISVLSLLPSELPRGSAPLAWKGILDLEANTAIASAASAVGSGLLAALVCTRILQGNCQLPARLRLLGLWVLGTIACAICLVLIAWGDPHAGVRAAGRLSADHALTYAGLGLLLALGWRGRVDLRLLGALALALSGVLEALQDPLPGRSASGWDLLANGVGLAAGLGAGGLLTARPRRNDGGDPAPLPKVVAVPHRDPVQHDGGAETGSGSAVP